MSGKLDYRAGAEYVVATGDTASAANLLRSAADEIARLTEALIRLVNYLGAVGAAKDDAIHELVRQARAVLADEEDAAT